MLYSTPQEWRNSKKKRVLLFGMSGLGKTFISNMLRVSGDWFHYSIDYRIGTRYMGEFISDSYKLSAMKTPHLNELLMSDSIYIASNITFENLTPLSNYLGKPGNVELGGIPISEYEKRQAQHRQAEISALLDTGYFSQRSSEIYQYDNFICDSGGSICEVVNPDNPNDPVLKHLFENTLLVWIKGSKNHTTSLIERFDKNPKPMCYEKGFLSKNGKNFLKQNKWLTIKLTPMNLLGGLTQKQCSTASPDMKKWQSGVSVLTLKI
jgi:hypothetical protein